MFLLAWLPVFMLAANAMAMQMSFDASMPMYEQHTAPHAGCHQSAPSEKQPQKQAHHCVVCGVCVISQIMHYHSLPQTLFVEGHDARPQAFQLHFTSQDYPPAIKPPIFN